MDAHLIDSAVFGHQWATAESRAIFCESARIDRWLEVIVALADAQAECGIIPARSAAAIGELQRASLPIDDIAARTRETSHSTLGMIQVLREHLPAEAREHVYFGTTVQDISDTAQVLELRAVGEALWRDLRHVEGDLLLLAREHRDTPMAGRTHGQIGSPIAFGFKVASWCDQIGRHLERLKEGRDRWLVGQLGGAVGTLAFFGDRALALRAAFCRRLALLEPDISWLVARDRLAEFAHLLASATSVLARIADEVFTLQRPEIGELSERTRATTVGSITMPHKRNPENSEQIVALARLVRAQAGVLADTLVQTHERDARGWKVEWAAFPELCHFAMAAAAMSRELVAGLEVDAGAMRRNLGIFSSSEDLLAKMSARLGKHCAQQALHEAYRRARVGEASLETLLGEIATEAERASVGALNLGASGLMVDRVVTTATRRRASESAQWATGSEPEMRTSRGRAGHHD